MKLGIRLFKLGWGHNAETIEKVRDTIIRSYQTWLMVVSPDREHFGRRLSDRESRSIMPSYTAGSLPHPAADDEWSLG
jgi:hypothetical protein